MSCTAPSTCTRTRSGRGAQTANSTVRAQRASRPSHGGIAEHHAANPAPNRRGARHRAAAAGPGRTMADWVELRVHGVSGTPPEDMLASAHVVQVAGDDRTRCFRPADTLGREVRGTAGQLLEAFHWGRWTSGSWAQALWLLLTPFGLVNAAQFMLPPPWSAPARGRPPPAGRTPCAVRCSGCSRWCSRCCSAVAAAVVVVDLAVWQWLARRQLPVDDRVLVVTGLLVAAAIGFGLSLLGRTRQGPAYRFRASGQERAERRRPARPAERRLLRRRPGRPGAAGPCTAPPACPSSRGWGCRSPRPRGAPGRRGPCGSRRCCSA